MSARPDVAVIVVNYNGREITPPCLESIPPGAQVIVVDNGSRDGSADEIAGRFPSVTLIRNPVNRGFAAAVNQGIDASLGRYVCLLNNDARLAPEALRTLVAYLDAHPDVGIVAPQLLHEDGRKQHSFDNFPSLATVFLNKSLLRTLFPGRYPSKKQECAEPRDVESAIGACMLVRRELIDRIGKLDEAYFLFLEETDWCLRARRAGSRVAFVPQARVVHLQGRTRDKVRIRGRIEYTRSLFRFFRKNRPFSYLLLRGAYPLKNLVEFVFQTATLFLKGVPTRWVETAALLVWQACLCPRSFGLSRGADPKYVTLSDGTRVSEDHLEAFNDFERKRASARVIKDLRHKKTLLYTAGEKSYFVKVYKRGSWGRRLRAALAGSKAEREFGISFELLRRGVPTVPVVAMRARGGESWVAGERLDGWSQLQEVLLSEATPPGQRRRLLSEYGKFARRLQDAGVWQYDFNPTNILVKDLELRVLDFERMKLRAGRLSEGERLALIAKMNRIPKLSRADRLRFLKGYVRASCDEGRRLGEIARTLQRLGARQEARDAAKAERRCTAENRDFGRLESAGLTCHYLKLRPERIERGLTTEEARALVEGKPPDGAFREDPSAAAIDEWRRAHRQPRRGGALPVAVVVRKGAAPGKLLYFVSAPPREALISGTKEDGGA